MQERQGANETPRRFPIGIDDVVIVPLVLILLIAKMLLRWTWSLLVHLLDHVVFPITMQAARLALFTFRILGDAATGLLRYAIKLLPLPSARRDSWREAVARAWAWMRRKLSYAAFEAFLHHVFEDGMAWVFRKCRRLSPGRALLVILVAVVWMPTSFILGTTVHTWLIVNAASLPAWMQVGHVFAVLIPKTKLLTLPVFPAAWPQAKLHGIVRFGARAWHYVTNLFIARKARARFGLIDDVGNRIADRAATRLGLDRLWRAVRDGTRAAGNWFAALSRRIARRLERLPVLGPVFLAYAEHYDRLGDAPRLTLSQKIKAFIQRWEIKFTPAYYEAKDAAARQAAPPVAGLSD